ncbi:sensor histidine kinase [Porphyromonas gulae]|uniref:histidine kinase n=2 Tax=Porphyromonas gulae TaxID=111105 RepID=A0A0A2F3V4_9PORP|nr:ATP-binding protein [Porphyromonas gulae]KGN85711.1 histidine kinase [Porphyromonas gulae]
MGRRKTSSFGLHLLFTIVMAVVGTWSAVAGHYVITVFAAGLVFFSAFRLRLLYRHHLQDLSLLLNAIENGDYSVRFSEMGGNASHRTFNRTLNRIKEILSRSRDEAIAGEQFLVHVLEQIPVGIMMVAPEGYVYSTNTVLLRLLGLPVITHLDQLGRVSPDMPRLFRSAATDSGIHVKLTTEREEKEVSLRFSSFRIRGKIYHIYTLSNIGKELDARETESWIRLIRVMTHEIMNSIAPITSICDTLLDNLQSSADEEMLSTGLDTIRSTGAGLLSFVQDYRKFTAIPSPEKEDIALYAFLTGILRLQEELLSSNGIKVDMEEISVGLTVPADRQQLTSVLINLVKNAAEAEYPADTEKRLLRIRVEERLDSSDEYRLLLHVENNGTPIPQEVFDNMFVPFYTTKTGGSGIGLSLSRYIIRLHGGNLLARRTADGFTSFVIELPL